MTHVPTPGPPRPDPAPRLRVRVRRATAPEYPAGVEIALAAKRATGFPLDTTLADLGPRFAARQQAAAGVWLAFLDDQPVGHALAALVPASNPTWAPVDDPVVAEARDRGVLVELGGLVVAPTHQRHGIAAALVKARIDWARQEGLLGCVAAWDDSPGSRRLAERHGRLVGRHPSQPIGLFVYDRA